MDTNYRWSLDEICNSWTKISIIHKKTKRVVSSGYLPTLESAEMWAKAEIEQLDTQDRLQAVLTQHEKEESHD